MTKRKTKKPNKKMTSVHKKKTAWQMYVAQREQFFKDHPNIRVLLAVFAVSFVLYMAMVYNFFYVIQ